MFKRLLPITVLASLVVGTFSLCALAQEPSTPAPIPDQPTSDTTAPDTTPPADGDGTQQPPSEPTQAPAPAAPAVTTETSCTDSVDNDLDGDIDCNDKDCANDDACRQPSVVPFVFPTFTDEPAGEESQTAKGDRPAEQTLGVEGFFGLSGRLGSPPSGFDATERAGLVLGASALFAPDRLWAVGLSYAYTGYGAEEFVLDNSPIMSSIDRSLHTLALVGRAYPWRTDSMGLWGGLMLGMTWQKADTRGVLRTGQFGSSIRPYATSADPDLGLSLGASIGFDLALDRNFAFLTSLNFTHHRLTGDPLDTDDQDVFLPGVGATSQLDFRLALQYRFDISSWFGGSSSEGSVNPSGSASFTTE